MFTGRAKVLVCSYVIALLVATLVAPAALAGPRKGGNKGIPPSFVYEGTGCVESVFVTPVDTDRLTPFVPDRFEVVEVAPGKALFGIAIASCEGISVDGSTPKPGVFSDMGIQIASPDASEGTHYYQVWQVENLAALHSKMRTVGIPGSLDRKANHSVGTVGSLITANGSVHWNEAPYAIEVTTRPYEAPRDGGNHWWHVGRHGLVRISYEFADYELALGGMGQLDTEAGSPVAEMVGGDSATGTAVNIRLDLEGLVEVVEPDATT